MLVRLARSCRRKSWRAAGLGFTTTRRQTIPHPPVRLRFGRVPERINAFVFASCAAAASVGSCAGIEEERVDLALGVAAARSGPPRDVAGD